MTSAAAEMKAAASSHRLKCRRLPAAVAVAAAAAAEVVVTMTTLPPLPGCLQRLMMVVL